MASAALLAIALPQAPAGAAGPVGPLRLPATPLLSVRRIPGWVDQTIAMQKLAARLSAAMANPAVDRQSACLTVSQGGAQLYSENPLKSLIPASNMKLLTSTAVLDKLGAGARLTTVVKAAKPVRGVVHGNLYLVGSGDPLLRTSGYASVLGPDQAVYTSLDQLARQVRAAGVTQITGSVVGDESRFDQQRTVPTWSPVYAAEGDVGPLSALDVNDGAEPSGQTGSGTVSAARLAAANSADPAVRAADTFTRLLGSDGVKVPGVATSGSTPAGTPVLTQIAGPPISTELESMLNVSDDTAAELLIKELGYQVSRKGTTAAGVAAMRADLEADGLPVSQLVALDGSGLDRGDRVTCNLLQADLQRVGPTGVIARGLPVAGKSGTLQDRMNGTPAAGRVHAKTGTLDDVIALSGFVMPARNAPTAPGSVLGQPIVFSLILDGVPTDSAGRSVADGVAVVLAEYPQVPELASLEPVP